MKVNFDELECDSYDYNYGMRYKGELFSGIAYEDYNGLHSEYSYLNGNTNGRCTTVNENGQLEEEEYYENGECISSKKWTKDGVLISDCQKSPLLCKSYFPNGNPKFYGDDKGFISYYQNGNIQKKHIYEEKLFTIFAEDGTWLSKIKPDGENLNRKTFEPYYVDNVKENLIFNEDYIKKNYISILKLDNELKNDDCDLEFEGFFIQWLLQKTESEMDEIISSLIKDDDIEIKKIGLIQVRVRKRKNLIPLLKKQLHIEEVCKNSALSIGKFAEEIINDFS